MTYSHLTKGSFLIAGPETESGVYFRSVLILCEHSSAGSFGLMINKPLDIELPEEVLGTKEFANPKVRIQTGGPIQPSQMMLLHTSSQISEQTLELCPGVHLGGDLHFLQESVNDPQGPAVRLCFGYAGWGPGQLEKEAFSGNWFSHPGSYTHVFETPAERVWQTILREMGGKYATFSMIPEDLSLN